LGGDKALNCGKRSLNCEICGGKGTAKYDRALKT